MKLQSAKTLLTVLLGAGMSHGLLQAQNPFYDSGDLVLFLQKPGSTDSIFVSLGNAATLYRGSAAGSTADRQALNIVNINTQLTSAFGTGWASDPDVYAGLIGCRDSSTGLEVFDGDQTRTLYASRSRNTTGTAGSSDSTAWDFTLSAASTAGATSAVAFGNIFESNYNTKVAVSPVSVSKVDNYNPFLDVTLGIQSTAFNAFPGGIQQRGSGTTLTAFGPITNPEFLLDLYRIVPRLEADTEGEVSGVRRIGSYEGTIVISASGGVSFITQPFAGAPEIIVENTDTNPVSEIPDGQALDFGSVTINTQSPTSSYQIRNSGNLDLTGISLSLSGTNAAEFEVTQPSATELIPGASTPFTVIFKPTSSGSKTATIQIASNDSDENPYDIVLIGTVPFPVPEISVTGPSPSSALLVDNSPSSSQNFGSVLLGATSTTRTFTIRNTGDASLTGISLSVAGTLASDFKITQPTADSLASNATTTFTIAFKPGASGSRSAVVRIASNDTDENPFDISVSGTGVAPVVPAPEIEIQHITTILRNGESKVTFRDTKAKTKKGNVQKFTIRNLSTATANLTGLSVSVAGKDFKPSELKTTSLPPGGSTSFTVTFLPKKKGKRTATLTVTSSDKDEKVFNITLSGKGT